MWTGMSASTAMMRMRMRRNTHRKPMMDQRPMCRTEGIAGDVDGYEREHGDDMDVDGEEVLLQAEDGSTQNVED
jgi:hypothetical protein